MNISKTFWFILIILGLLLRGRLRRLRLLHLAGIHRFLLLGRLSYLLVQRLKLLLSQFRQQLFLLCNLINFNIIQGYFTILIFLIPGAFLVSLELGHRLINLLHFLLHLLSLHIDRGCNTDFIGLAGICGNLVFQSFHSRLQMAEVRVHVDVVWLLLLLFLVSHFSHLLLMAVEWHIIFDGSLCFLFFFFGALLNIIKQLS